MSAKLVVLRERARRDIEDAIDHYAAEAGEKIALGFIEALQAALGHIASHPASGSPRYAHELDLVGLRAWRLKRYPYLVFYLEQPGHIDVWRVLHTQRDIPVWMRDD